MDYYGNPQSIQDIPLVKMFNQDIREAILVTHNVVSELGLWVELGRYNDSKYYFSISEAEIKILRHPKIQACKNGHMIDSLCFDIMVSVAKNGWKHGFDDFVNNNAWNRNFNDAKNK